jgi:hypothetical protein
MIMMKQSLAIIMTLSCGVVCQPANALDEAPLPKPKPLTELLRERVIQGDYSANTHLDSFVYQSGYNDRIYGDSEDQSPPPYFDLEYIEDGVNSPGGDFYVPPNIWIGDYEVEVF